jgi:hypothetical protein
MKDAATCGVLDMRHYVEAAAGRHATTVNVGCRCCLPCLVLVFVACAEETVAIRYISAVADSKPAALYAEGTDSDHASQLAARY